MSISSLNKKAIIYNPYNSFGGGGEIQKKLFEVINNSLYSFDVTVFSSANNLNGLRLYLFRLLSVFKNRSLFANCDLLIIQSIFDPGSILLGYYARIFRINYFVIPRGDFVPTKANITTTKNYYIKRLIWFFFGKSMVKSAKAIIVTSHFEKDRLKAVSARENHIELIPDPTFDNILLSNNQILDISPDIIKETNKPFALWLGRFSKEKGLDLIIDAWRDVLNVIPQAKLLLVGSIYQKEEYERISKKILDLNLKNHIVCLSWVSGPDKDYLLKNARCLVLPSFYESFGIVVAESLSFSTPVIVSDGTPWSNISKKAGYCLPRISSMWVSVLITYLNASEKIKVPDNVIIDTLKPFSTAEITLLWKNLFSKYLFNDNLNK